MASTKTNRSESRFLDLAAIAAKKSSEKGWGGPFGAVIVRKGRVLAIATNTVLKNNDATCHAEINAIRIASMKRRAFSLNDCEIYSTTEPCPMCFSAIHWARLKSVCYSTTIAEVHRLGFNELTVSNLTLKKLGKSPVQLRQISNEACRRLLLSWKNLPVKQTY